MDADAGHDDVQAAILRGHQLLGQLERGARDALGHIGRVLLQIGGNVHRQVVAQNVGDHVLGDHDVRQIAAGQHRRKAVGVIIGELDFDVQLFQHLGVRRVKIPVLAVIDAAEGQHGLLALSGCHADHQRQRKTQRQHQR